MVSRRMQALSPGAALSLKTPSASASKASGSPRAPLRHGGAMGRGRCGTAKKAMPKRRLHAGLPSCDTVPSRGSLRRLARRGGAPTCAPRTTPSECILQHARMMGGTAHTLSDECFSKTRSNMVSTDDTATTHACFTTRKAIIQQSLRLFERYVHCPLAKRHLDRRLPLRLVTAHLLTPMLTQNELQSSWQCSRLQVSNASRAACTRKCGRCWWPFCGRPSQMRLRLRSTATAAPSPSTTSCWR
jgi:hypothetical protein